MVEPLAAVEVNVPGVIEMLVAPVVTQLSVLLPELRLTGLAVNDEIVGGASCSREPCPPADDPEEPQLSNPRQSNKRKMSAKRPHFETLRS